MNWEDLYYRAIKPQYTPTVDEIDITNPLFGTVEEIILNDELLEPIRGRKNSPTGWDTLFANNKSG